MSFTRHRALLHRANPAQPPQRRHRHGEGRANRPNLAPAGTDGISIVPTLLGRGSQAKHEFLYWELVRNDATVFRRGARMKDWKVVQNVIRMPPELYNLRDDPGEQSNLASKHTEIVQKIEARMKAVRTPARAYERGYRPGAADYVR